MHSRWNLCVATMLTVLASCPCTLGAMYEIQNKCNIKDEDKGKDDYMRGKIILIDKDRTRVEAR